MDSILERFHLEPFDPEKISPVAMAYIGDTVFDLYLRTQIVANTKLNPHEMHTKTSSFANAGAQATMARRILDNLTDEEQRVLKRSRNQRSISVPKNASPIDYKWATGFETLLGWLYLTKQEERLFEVMKLAVGNMIEGI